MTIEHVPSRPDPRARLALAAIAALLVALDLGLKTWASRALAYGVSLGSSVVQLRLTFNSGVAFGVGGALPGWVILGVTGCIIFGLALFAWRGTLPATLLGRLGLAAVLAGAIANFADRAIDGVVTDYLHTGWFPTFNLADVFITVGAAAMVLSSLHTSADAVDPTTR